MPITPNMNLDLPVPTVEPGPDWATELNTALETIDQHDHTPGKGVPVPAAGINIDDTLSANSNTITELRTTQYDSQSAPISGVSEANSVQMVAGNLWIVNGSGTAVQVTSGTSVVAPSSTNTPAGIVLPYAGSSAPAGYLICDGTAVSRGTYATLFGVIGTVYGVGDGSTTFNLPNMQGRTPIGTGTYTDTVSGSVTRTLGQVLGAEKHALTTSELASHNHGVTDPGHNHTMPVYGQIANANTVYTGLNNQVGTASTSTETTGIDIDNTGLNTPHNNMQPSLGLNFIIKT